MRKFMKYKYGPLIWNCSSDADESGNFYWYGSPPTGYDNMGIPIDEQGFQCLPDSCPLHPSYQPQETSFHSLIEDSLPTIQDFKVWFEEHFLIVTDVQIARYIIRWYSFDDIQRRTSQQQKLWDNVINTYRTRERLVMHLWPGLTK
jgi:hypothetical protein